MNTGQFSGLDAVTVLKFAAILIGAYLAFIAAAVVLRAAAVVLERGHRLSRVVALQAGEAAGLALTLPFEWALNRSDQWLAQLSEHRRLRKAWRTEFRAVMSWDEFKRQIAGASARDELSEAIALLGLPDGFSRADVDTRFRQLVQGVHPDKGGSAPLTQLVTDARAMIIKRKGWRR